MITSVSMKIFSLICVFLPDGSLSSDQAERHSLYYIYTALSKPVDLPGIYEFTAMGLLDDRQIDYYNSEDKRKIPKQTWMKEKMEEDYWDKGTQSRKSKEQWFNVNVHILMDRMRHDQSDVHVLQWRVGCEVEREGNEVKFSRGIDEYSYDGENFLSFDDEQSQWVAPVDAALPTKRKWDNVPMLNQYTKGYLEKECVDWLNIFRQYGDSSPPDVYIFVRNSISDKTKLRLTCLATGFYPKDMMMLIRKYRRSLPEDEVESTGIRPNHDGSFQMRKSVEIQKDEKADYDCFVSHKSIKEPVIKKWDGKCRDCQPETASGLIRGLIFLAVVPLLVFILKKKRIIGLITRKRKKHISANSERGIADEEEYMRATGSQEDLNPLIPGEMTISDKVQLLDVLRELDSRSLWRFKRHLIEQYSVELFRLEDAKIYEIVDLMMLYFGLTRAVEITVEILKEIMEFPLAKKLEKQTRRKVLM